MRTSPTSYVERVIAKFGGLSATARALGHKNPTTVQGWLKRGVIPARQQQPLLNAAAVHGIHLSPGDFFERSSPAEPAAEGAAA